MIAASDIVTVTLAAGRAERFGGGKLDAVLDGHAVGMRAQRVLSAFEWRASAIVVPRRVPSYAKDLAAHFVKSRVELLINPVDGADMSSSLAIATRFARKSGASGLLIVLADMPFITSDSIKKLLRAIDESNRKTIAAMRYPGSHTGAPALFTAPWFAALESLTGDRGARSLLSAHARHVAVVEPSHHQLLDIDTIEDLATARHECTSGPGQPRRAPR